MSTAHWIALILFLIGLAAPMIAFLIAKKQTAATITHLKTLTRNSRDFADVLTRKSQHYQTQGQALGDKLTFLKTQVGGELNVFGRFMTSKEQLTESMRYLELNGPRFARDASLNFYNDVKRDGPKIAKTTKLAFKKMRQKRQNRRRQQEGKVSS